MCILNKYAHGELEYHVIISSTEFSNYFNLVAVFGIMMLFQVSPGNCNQLSKHDSDPKITTVPSVAVHNSSANIQVTHLSKQIQAVSTPSHFPSGTLQTSLPVSKCNSDSLITTSLKQATSSTQEIAHISSVNNEGKH